MLRTLMKSKVHRAIVTEANLHYVGSLTMDKDLMDLADLSVNEKVQVVDIDNGERFETYIIEGERGSGVLCLNGAAARRAQPGDKVIVISYAVYDEQEVKEHSPRVVVCDEHNHGDLLVAHESPATTTEQLLAGDEREPAVLQST
ncbi:aspartate 1-decarboxylase [Actinocrispum sp. NPDC049592]|uniref:aspartate 1-decarboxylase n=1 Tax=Actinocrispum sp. NPDC049592 TaxID=3154835 RepID=UPI00341E1856